MPIATNTNPQKILVMVGNSRIHWAYYDRGECMAIVHSDHRDRMVEIKEIGSLFSRALPQRITITAPGSIPLIFASVVPSQDPYFAAYPGAVQLTLTDIPLKNTYPTLGIDRALALVGAAEQHGWPCLVIDGGTALTYTGANERGELVGGAIAVGIKQQLLTLSRSTANLPLATLNQPDQIWASNTQDAIVSGVVNHTLAGVKYFIAGWLHQYPGSAIVLTGGDGQLIYDQLQRDYPVIYSNDCIFRAMAVAVG